MNEFTITPFRGLHLLLLLLTAAAVLLIFLLLRGKPEARRSRFLIGVCFFNLALFAGYKLSLSMDAAYVRAYYPNGFNIFNELPLHLCNINLFLIPLGVWKRNRSIMGFSFFVAPLGALMALLFPEPLFSGFSLFLRPESGDAGLLPPRPQGYPADPQDLWFACRRCAPYQSPVTPHGLPGGKLLLHLRRRDRRSQAVLAYHPGAAALRAAGTADPCRLYVRSLCVVPPGARSGRRAFFINWISPTAQKQEDTTLLHRNVRGIGIALCLLTLLLSLSGCGSLKDDTLLTVNAVITEVDATKKTIPGGRHRPRYALERGAGGF